MDQYIYILLGVAALLPVIFTYIVRLDLRRDIIKVGLIGGLAGIVAEFFYTRDYWHPIGVFGNQTYLEDFIFGFAITSLSAMIYSFVVRKKQASAYPNKRRSFMVMFAIGVAGMLVFHVWLGGNSTIVSSLIFIAIAVYIIMKRKDLARSVFISTTLVTLYLFLVYVVLFYILEPSWWSKHWLLDGTIYDIKLWGSIPLTEMLWYIAWTMLGAASLPYLRGKKYTNSLL